MSTSARSDPLASTGWLAERLSDPAVRVLDATWFMPNSGRDARAEFVAGHIPGAQVFDIDTVANTGAGLPHMLPSPEMFAEAVSKMGVGFGVTVVTYDTNVMMASARAWWMFRAMGHEAVKVLDGGLALWRAQGRPLEHGSPAEPGLGRASNITADFRPGLVRSFDQVKADMGQVVDARPSARFRGETPEPRPGLRSGHMPGARNLPHANLLTPEGRLKPRDELASVFTAAGVDPAARLIASCGSGVSACVVALAAARLGSWETAIYDGSWTEWGARVDAPVVTGG